MQKDNIEETPQEEVQELKYYQWIKGDQSGSVVTIKEEDSNWITFNEGGRLATEFRSEFIQELDSDIAGEFINTPNSTVDPLNQSATSVDPITKSDPIIPALDTTPSPIRVLFDKQKKNNKVKLLLEFPINIPTKGVYELMSTSFDKKEVDEQLHDFIVDQLDEDEITDYLFDSIKSLIESKYKGE
tara:strand:- start:34 stop:591 length:558 start_codon:yes stop_codon:yes gene_type:complete